eukprot:GSChrysophyteH1.ASY1.ANO1.87.1 assembled CDS
MSDSKISSFVEQYREGSITGADLATMEKEGTISKSERRIIVKQAKKSPPKELSERQKLRLLVKEKKSQPRQRMTAEERREKYSDLDEKQMERYNDASSYVICLGCREKGHYLKDCPNANLENRGAYGGQKPGLICFNCGAADHALRACAEPRDPGGALPFATCFICKNRGHLSRDCSENAHGLYPKGGSCHICFQKDHLVKDCPQRTEEHALKWAESQALKRLEQEEREFGPKVSGLTAEEGDGGAEYMAPVKTRFSDGDSGSEEESDKKRKHKDKGDSKKKKKKKKESKK